MSCAEMDLLDDVVRYRGPLLHISPNRLSGGGPDDDADILPEIEFLADGHSYYCPQCPPGRREVFSLRDKSMNLARHFKDWLSTHGELGRFATSLRLTYCPSHRCYAPEGHHCFKKEHSALLASLQEIKTPPKTSDGRPRRKLTPSKKALEGDVAEPEAEMEETSRRSCTSKRKLSYYQNNREQVREQQKEYYNEQKESIREQQKEYYKQKKERHSMNWLFEEEMKTLSKQGIRMQSAAHRQAVIEEAKAFLNSDPVVCAVCDEFVHEAAACTYSLDEVPNTLFEAVKIHDPDAWNPYLLAYYDVTDSIQDEHHKRRFANLWLSKKGVVQENRQTLICICDSCDNTLRQSKQKKQLYPPALAIANGFQIGIIPEELYTAATQTDLALVSKQKLIGVGGGGVGW